MPSFSQRIASLVDTYQHSKTSPAYRELNVKYKTLKSTNQELIHLLTNVLSKTLEMDKKPRRRLRSKKIRRSKTETPIHYEDDEVVIKEEQELRNPSAKPLNSSAYTSLLKLETIVIDTDVETEQIYIEKVIEDEKDTPVVEEEEEVVEEEEVEQEEVEQEVVEQEVVEEEVVEQVVVEEEVVEEEETGVYEIEIDDIRYYTTGEQNGVVYALLEDDDVGDEVGNFVNGKFVRNK